MVRLDESLVETLLLNLFEKVPVKKIATLAAIAGIAAAALAASHANAAATADLNIKGNIVPAACTPTFAGGGVIDYGTILAGLLNKATSTALAKKNTTLTVTCATPALFGIKVVDGRLGTGAKVDTVPGTALSDLVRFGLGQVEVNGAKTNVGAYSTRLGRVTSGTGTTAMLRGPDAGASEQAWAPFPLGFSFGTGRTYAFAGSAKGTAPSAHKSITVNFDVQTVIVPSDGLPLTEDIPLDGLSTFEVVYL